MVKYKFQVNDITCASCVIHIEKALKKIDGVDDVKVNYLTKRVNLNHSENVTTTDIDKVVKKVGYTPTAYGNNYHKHTSHTSHGDNHHDHNHDHHHF